MNKVEKYKGIVFLVPHICLGTNVLVPARLEIYYQHL